jgi:hypothetical protein
MVEAKHTPGPWRVDDGDDDFPIIGHPTWKCRRFGVNGEWQIASVDDLAADDLDDEKWQERLANAHLIAAAPELLASLKDCISRLVAAFPDCEEYKPIQDARAAIAKAEGRS